MTIWVAASGGVLTRNEMSRLRLRPALDMRNSVRAAVYLDIQLVRSQSAAADFRHSALDF
jgi:hypothetical protein